MIGILLIYSPTSKWYLPHLSLPALSPDQMLSGNLLGTESTVTINRYKDDLVLAKFGKNQK
jgi:hypothetical protein